MGLNSDILDLFKRPMPLNSDKLPELVIVDESDPAAARRIRRLAVAGRLRRLHAGVYTSNLDAPWKRSWLAIGNRSLGTCFPAASYPIAQRLTASRMGVRYRLPVARHVAL